jgi:hypothetical protein
VTGILTSHESRDDHRSAQTATGFQPEAHSQTRYPDRWRGGEPEPQT